MPVVSTPLIEQLAVTACPSISSSASELTAMLHQLRPASDPLPVFRSLTRVVVPRLCDSSTVRLCIGGQSSQLGYRVTSSTGYEQDGSDTGAEYAEPGADALRHDLVTVPIEPSAVEGQPSYRGVLTMRFYGLRPTLAHLLFGQLLVEHAIALVQREQQTAKIANLQCALSSNREIGAAMGILMARHQLTATQAFDLLRRTSQHCHRRIVAIAAEVIETGALDLPDGVDLLECRPTPGPPRRPPHLRVAR
jgi:hypothetical protein